MLYPWMIRHVLLLTGTRYKKRGVDADGHTANYVETEQVGYMLKQSR